MIRTTVIIPVFNGADHVAAAIDSALEQTAPVKVIVVDDGSDDGTAAIVDAYARRGIITAITQPNRGAPAARNRGIVAATTEFLAFLDADDTWDSDKTRLQTTTLDEDPALDAAFGTLIPMAADATAVIATPHGDLAGLASGTMQIRRSAFDRVGPFSETVKAGEFIEWFARAQDIGMRWALVPGARTLRRIHATNMTRRGGTFRSDLPHALRAVLQRRREDKG